MGWYDAYRKDNATAAVLNTITSDSGSAGKNFGDAFVDFSKSLMDSEDAKDKSKLVGLQATNEQNKLDTFTETKKQNKIDDAFKKDFNFDSKNIQYQKDLLEFEKPDGTFDSDVSNSALEYANNKIQLNEKVAQQKFNDEALEQSVVKPYKNMQKFVESNPDLVKNADGVTMSKIENYFAGKDKTLATLSAKEKDIKQATALTKLEARLNQSSTKNSKADKPLSLQAQSVLKKLIDNDNYKLDEKGKPEIDDDGNMILKDDISPAKNDFMVNAINKYMVTAGSDKNYKNARAFAMQSWDALPQDSNEKNLEQEYLTKKEKDSKNMFENVYDYFAGDGKKVPDTKADTKAPSIFEEFKKNKEL